MLLRAGAMRTSWTTECPLSVCVQTRYNRALESPELRYHPCSGQGSPALVKAALLYLEVVRPAVAGALRAPGTGLTRSPFSPPAIGRQASR